MCSWRSSPCAPAEKFQFVNAIKGGTIPREYIPAVEKGVREAMEAGVLAGYPMVDMKVTLVDGSYHDVDSSEMAFKIAGSMGFKEGAEKGPTDFTGARHGGGGRRPGRVYRRGQRGLGFPARKDPEFGGSGRSAGCSRPRCLWPKCSVTPPAVAIATPRAGRPLPCNFPIMSACRGCIAEGSHRRGARRGRAVPLPAEAAGGDRIQRRKACRRRSLSGRSRM